MNTKTKQDMIDELRSAKNIILQYVNYAARMTALGRGFNPTDDIGRSPLHVINGINSAIAKAKGE